MNSSKAVIIGLAGILLLWMGIRHVTRTSRIPLIGPAPLPSFPNDSYTVHGIASYDSLGTGAHFTNRFTLTVGNNCWAMETVPVQGTASGTHHIFDGTNLTAWAYFNTNQAPISRGSNSGFIVVDDTGMPTAMDNLASTIWVAYAAQFYLPPGTNGTVRPFRHPEREVRTQAFVPAQWSMLSPQGRLPEAIQFWYEPSGWAKALHNGQAPTSTNRAGHSIPIALHQSFGITNLAGQRFPLACSLTGFAGEHEYTTGERLPVCRIEVSQVEVNSNVEHRLFDSMSRGITDVEDWRGQQKQPLLYRLTNSVSPALSDPVRSAAAKSARRSEVASMRREQIACDWTVKPGETRIGLRLFTPVDNEGGSRLEVILGSMEISFGDDRSRPPGTRAHWGWVGTMTGLLLAGTATVWWKRHSHRRRGAIS